MKMYCIFEKTKTKPVNQFFENRKLKIFFSKTNAVLKTQSLFGPKSKTKNLNQMFQDDMANSVVSVAQLISM